MDKNLLFGFDEKKIMHHIENEFENNDDRLKYLLEMQKILASISLDEPGFRLDEKNKSSENVYIQYFLRSFRAKRSNKLLTNSKFTETFYQELGDMVYRISEMVKTNINFYQGIKESKAVSKKRRNKKLGDADANMIARIFYSMLNTSIIDIEPNINELANTLVSSPKVENFVSVYGATKSRLNAKANDKKIKNDEYYNKQGELLSKFIIHIIENNLSEPKIKEIFNSVNNKKRV